MDDLDHKILQLLAENARMPVKDIAQRVSLTSPAVSSRILVSQPSVTYVRGLDDHAFITIVNSSEIVGKGFRAI